MKTSTLITIVSLAAGITNSQAATTVSYTQSAAFFAALAAPAYAPSQTETYESYATDTNVNGVLGAYTYSGFPTYGPSPTANLTGRIDQRDQPGANVGFFSVAGGLMSLGAFYNQTSPPLSPSGDYFFNGEGFTVGLPVGTRAIGLFFNVGIGTVGASDLFINTAVGNVSNGGTNFNTTVGNNRAAVDGGSQMNLFFLGLISDTPFTSAQVGELGTGGVGFNVDNLTTATPEPTSIGLLCMGMAGIAGYSRRRKVS